MFHAPQNHSKLYDSEHSTKIHIDPKGVAVIGPLEVEAALRGQGDWKNEELQ